MLILHFCPRFLCRSVCYTFNLIISLYVIVIFAALICIFFRRLMMLSNFPSDYWSLFYIMYFQTFACFLIGSTYFFSFFFRTMPMAYGSSQARGLNWSYSCQPTPQPQKLGSEPCLRPIPQLTAMPDP